MPTPPKPEKPKQNRNSVQETTYLNEAHLNALKNLCQLSPHIKKSHVIAEAILYLWERAKHGFDGAKLRPITFKTEEERRARIGISVKDEKIIGWAAEPTAAYGGKKKGK